MQGIMQVRCIVYIVLSSAILYGCKDTVLGQQLPQSPGMTLQRDPQRAMTQIPAQNPGKKDPKTHGEKDPKTDTDAINQRLKTQGDIALLGINEASYQIVMGQTPASQSKRALSALSALKIVIPTFTTATKEEVNSFGINHKWNTGWTNILRVLEAVATFLETDRGTVLAAFVNSSDNTVPCQIIRDSINGISSPEKKQKAWALAQFLSTALYAVHVEYHFSSEGISQCKWNAN